MLALLLESALRALALGAAVWLGLKILRIRNVHAEITAWRTVLIVSLAMPLLVQFAAPWARVTILVAVPPQVTAPIATKIEAESPTFATPAPDSAVEPMAVPTSPLAGSQPKVSAPPPITPRRDIDWQALMTAVYLAVAAVLLMRPLIGIALTIRLMRAARPVRQGWAAGRDVRVSDDITMPVTFGGAILLPADYVDWSAARQAGRSGSRKVTCRSRRLLDPVAGLPEPRCFLVQSTVLVAVAAADGTRGDHQR